MNKIKKILLLTTAITVLMLCFVFSSSAATSGYYTYTVSNGKAIITDVNTSISGDVIVPSKLGGCAVEEIGSYAFENCANITNVTLPGTLKKINGYGFYNCYRLQTIAFPSQLKSIEPFAFSYCTSLEYVDIPDSTTNIGMYAFSYCESIKDVNIGNNVKIINKGVFGYCTDLDYIIIPRSVTYIDEFAFFNCNNLRSIYYESYAINWNKIQIAEYNDVLHRAVLYPSMLELPGNFRGSTTTNSASFKWDPVEGAAGYKVYIKSGSSWKAIKNVTNSKITVEGLAPGTKYTFAVKPYGRHPNGKFFYEDGYTSTYSATKPVNITKVSTKPATDGITVSWTAVNCSGYRVYVKTSSGWKTLKTTTATSYKVTGLTDGKKYIFAVRPYAKHSGYTAWANKYTTVTTVKLATPTISLATTAKGRATVAWTNVAGETGYQVYYATSKTGTYKKIANYKANTTKIYKTGLTSGKTYYFKVRAYTNTDSGYVYSAYSPVKGIKIK